MTCLCSSPVRRSRIPGAFRSTAEFLFSPERAVVPPPGRSSVTGRIAITRDCLRLVAAIQARSAAVLLSSGLPAPLKGVTAQAFIPSGGMRLTPTRGGMVAGRRAETYYARPQHSEEARH